MMCTTHCPRNCWLSPGDHITDVIADKIEESPIESVEVRSALTCKAKKEFVLSATEETLPPIKWFRLEKL